MREFRAIQNGTFVAHSHSAGWGRCAIAGRPLILFVFWKPGIVTPGPHLHDWVVNGGRTRVWNTCDGGRIICLESDFILPLRDNAAISFAVLRSENLRS